MEVTPLFIWLFVQGALGAICASIANSRGRNPVGWFFVGFFFGCLPIIILLVLPNPKEEEKKFERLQQENRRLRESLQKDRMVADDRHGAVEGRLTAHDRALGLDTTPIGRAEDAGEPPALEPAASAGEQWFYAVDGERFGPVARAELGAALGEGKLDRETLLWRKGMDAWQRLAELPELLDELQGGSGA
jgi:hypothetical protein